MGLSANIIEGWLLLTNDVKLRTVKRVENRPDESKTVGWLEQSDESVIIQKRHFIGLSGFSESTGDEASSWSWYVGGGKTVTFARDGPSSEKYLCTGDRMEIEDHVTGSGWQTQTWELNTDWTPVEDSYYEKAIT